MSLKTRGIRSILVASLMLAPVMITGCASHVGVGYRVRDPYYRDYHAWNGPEVGYYNQWVIETRRPNREFRRLRRDEQRQYWKWRHDRDHR